MRLQNAAARKGKGLTDVLRRLEISVKYEAGALCEGAPQYLWALIAI